MKFSQPPNYWWITKMCSFYNTSHKLMLVDVNIHQNNSCMNVLGAVIQPYKGSKSKPAHEQTLYLIHLRVLPLTHQGGVLRMLTIIKWQFQLDRFCTSYITVTALTLLMWQCCHLHVSVVSVNICWSASISWW